MSDVAVPEKVFLVRVRIERFEVKPDDRGYLNEYNKIQLLEVCIDDVPPQRYKAAHLVNTVLTDDKPRFTWEAINEQVQT